MYNPDALTQAIQTGVTAEKALLTASAAPTQHTASQTNRSATSSHCPHSNRDTEGMLIQRAFTSVTT